MSRATCLMTADGITFMEDIMEEHEMSKSLEVPEVREVPVVGGPVDEFPDVDFGRILRNEFTKGYNAGYDERSNAADRGLRSRISNQRRELRRLNRQLNALIDGIKLQRAEEAKVRIGDGSTT